MHSVVDADRSKVDKSKRFSLMLSTAAISSSATVGGVDKSKSVIVYLWFRLSI